jgi:hypothetical protein
MGCRQTTAVVPANAGTHTPRPLVLEKTRQRTSHQLRSVAMGPCVRRDDGRAFVFNSQKSRRTFAISRHDVPEACLKFTLESERAQGMPGAGWHPRSRVQDALKNAHTSIQVQPEQPGIPCAMALRLMPCSPRRRIPLASVADELMARMTRLGVASLRQLDTSHGCQDHTVLPYAASSTKPFSQPVPPAKLLAKAFKRRSSARRARSRKPALLTLLAPTLPRPPQPVPTFVTMANAPLLRTG